MTDHTSIDNGFCSQRHLRIENFSYSLPDERIALYPLRERDASKLLVSRGDRTEESVFCQISQFIPERSLLVMNNTKVVHARLIFLKPEGGRIEIFCLQPLVPVDISMAFACKGEVEFRCLIGNNKKWKEGSLQTVFSWKGSVEKLTAERLRREGDAFVVRFSYSIHLSFSEILEHLGTVPLPPYIHREVEEQDKQRYQTVFARYDGSVAAPTAGLHFTSQLLKDLEKEGIERAYVTLHVGAGTFKPVKVEEVGAHEMHREYIELDSVLLNQLAVALKEKRKIIPVGTTSMRTLESIYWWGVQLLENPSPAAMNEPFNLDQWTPYEKYGAHLPYTSEKVVEALQTYLQQTGMRELHGYTALMIAPAYPFAFCHGLITNFHQPQSTLLLLVSALIGERWKALYSYALDHDFRFLSYGDSCLFLP